MNNKALLLLQIILDGLLALFAISLPFWSKDVDQTGTIFAVVMALIFGGLALLQVRRLMGAGEMTTITPPAEAPAEDETKGWRNMIYLCLLAFPALMAITIMDLNDLESGLVMNVRLWSPIAFLYGHFGYWAAVLSIPLLGMVVVFLLYRQMQAPSVDELET